MDLCGCSRKANPYHDELGRFTFGPQRLQRAERIFLDSIDPETDPVKRDRDVKTILRIMATFPPEALDLLEKYSVRLQPVMGLPSPQQVMGMYAPMSHEFFDELVLEDIRPGPRIYISLLHSARLSEIVPHEMAHGLDNMLGRERSLCSGGKPDQDRYITDDPEFSRLRDQDIADVTRRAEKPELFQQYREQIFFVGSKEWIVNAETLAYGLADYYMKNGKGDVMFPRVVEWFFNKLDQWRAGRLCEGVRKYNPYHDERGRFTFAPAARVARAPDVARWAERIEAEGRDANSRREKVLDALTRMPKHFNDVLFEAGVKISCQPNKGNTFGEFIEPTEYNEQSAPIINVFRWRKAPLTVEDVVFHEFGHASDFVLRVLAPPTQGTDNAWLSGRSEVLRRAIRDDMDANFDRAIEEGWPQAIAFRDSFYGYPERVRKRLAYMEAVAYAMEEQLSSRYANGPRLFPRTWTIVDDAMRTLAARQRKKTALKANPYHDELGRFTFAPGHRAGMERRWQSRIEVEQGLPPDAAENIMRVMAAIPPAWNEFLLRQNVKFRLRKGKRYEPEGMFIPEVPSKRASTIEIYMRPSDTRPRPYVIHHEVGHALDFFLAIEKGVSPQTLNPYLSTMKSTLNAAIKEDLATTYPKALKDKIPIALSYKQNVDEGLVGILSRAHFTEAVAFAAEEGLSSYHRRYPKVFPRTWQTLSELVENAAQGKAIVKFNPYHDERGRFTFGPRSVAGRFIKLDDVPKIAENAVYHAFTNLLPSHLQKLFRIEGAHVALRKNFKYLGLFDPNGSMLEKGKPCITICTGLWAKFDGPNYVFEPPHEPPRTLIHEFAHLGDYALGRRDYLRDKTGPMWISMRDGPLKQAIMEDIANARGRAKQRLDRITSVYSTDWRTQHQEVLAVAFEEAYYEKRKRMSFPRAFRVFDQMLRQLVEDEERQAAGKAIIKFNPYHDERGRFTFAPASRRTQTDEELIDRLRDNPHRPTALVSVLTRLATLAVTDPDEGDRFLRQMVEKLGGPERRSSATHEVLRAMPAATHDQKILTAVADAYVRLRKSQRKWPPKVVDESIDPILMYASNEEEAAIGIQNYVGVHYNRKYQHYRPLLAAGAEEFLTNRLNGDHAPIARALRRIYDKTQAELRAKGIGPRDEIVVYRAHDVTQNSMPILSYTPVRSVARSFMTEDRIFFKRTVQAREILWTPVEGRFIDDFHSDLEHEFIVLTPRSLGKRTDPYAKEDEPDGSWRKKFNPYHDELGRFTFAPAHRVVGPEESNRVLDLVTSGTLGEQRQWTEAARIFRRNPDAILRSMVEATKQDQIEPMDLIAIGRWAENELLGNAKIVEKVYDALVQMIEATGGGDNEMFVIPWSIRMFDPRPERAAEAIQRVYGCHWADHPRRRLLHDAVAVAMGQKGMSEKVSPRTVRAVRYLYQLTQSQYDKDGIPPDAEIELYRYHDPKFDRETGGLAPLASYSDRWDRIEPYRENRIPVKKTIRRKDILWDYKRGRAWVDTASENEHEYVALTRGSAGTVLGPPGQRMQDIEPTKWRYETKFNPYHDERGRFTFAPAHRGPGSESGRRVFDMITAIDEATIEQRWKNAAKIVKQNPDRVLAEMVELAREGRVRSIHLNVLAAWADLRLMDAPRVMESFYDHWRKIAETIGEEKAATSFDYKALRMFDADPNAAAEAIQQVYGFAWFEHPRRTAIHDAIMVATGQKAMSYNVSPRMVRAIQHIYRATQAEYEKEGIPPDAEIELYRYHDPEFDSKSGKAAPLASYSNDWDRIGHFKRRRFPVQKRIRRSDVLWDYEHGRFAEDSHSEREHEFVVLVRGNFGQRVGKREQAMTSEQPSTWQMPKKSIAIDRYDAIMKTLDMIVDRSSGQSEILEEIARDWAPLLRRAARIGHTCALMAFTADPLLAVRGVAHMVRHAYQYPRAWRMVERAAESLETYRGDGLPASAFERAILDAALG